MRKRVSSWDDPERFREVLQRRPGFGRRFFSTAALAYCAAAGDPALRLAGTFAAKEAAMKALRLAPAVAWARALLWPSQRSGTAS